MQEVFSKIIEKLEELKKAEIERDDSCDEEGYGDGEEIYEDGKSAGRYEQTVRIIKIVKQEAEKFGTDTNVGSNGWIPCSVSMPVFGKRYLVTGVWKDKEYENYRVYDAVYGSDGIWHENYYDPVGYEVISWQPLPEPYQPKGE